MTYNPNLHHRRSIRLAGYDYSQPGAYYVTTCAARRECVFGDVVKGKMRLNVLGAIAEREWRSLPRHYPNVQLDAFIVMPNHVHGIILLADSGRLPLSEVVRVSRHGPPGASTNAVTPRARQSGNEIATSTSSAMRMT